MQLGEAEGGDGQAGGDVEQADRGGGAGEGGAGVGEGGGLCEVGGDAEEGLEENEEEKGEAESAVNDGRREVVGARSVSELRIESAMAKGARHTAGEACSSACTPPLCSIRARM